MKLIEEFVLTASLAEPVPIGKGPIGTRAFFGVTGGEIVGPRIKAKILSGGEWALVPSDNFVRVDVRFQAETDDGAFLYAQYFGLLERTQAVINARSTGKGTDFDDQQFYTNPRFETGDERYAWMNNTFFIGEGRMMPNAGVQYRVWRPA
jgi:hypothetical protein